MTNRELVEEIDQLIKLRVRQAIDNHVFKDGTRTGLFKGPLENEHAERIIRSIADAFQVRDPQKGVYTDPNKRQST